MSTKHNTERGGKKAKGWGSTVGGMQKHGRSGVAHNHALSIARVRDENKRLEEEATLRKKRKGTLYASVRELMQHSHGHTN